MSYLVVPVLNYTIIRGCGAQNDTKGDTLLMKKMRCLILTVCLLLLCLAACSSGKTKDAASSETAQSGTSADI